MITVADLTGDPALIADLTATMVIGTVRMTTAAAQEELTADGPMEGDRLAAEEAILTTGIEIQERRERGGDDAPVVPRKERMSEMKRKIWKMRPGKKCDPSLINLKLTQVSKLL